jgi:hypothetical protein
MYQTVEMDVKYEESSSVKCMGVYKYLIQKESYKTQSWQVNDL